MARKTITRPPASEHPAEKAFYIVNPAGTIHSCDYVHAKQRLMQQGYRTATKEEIAELDKRQGLQSHDKPICKPWAETVVSEQ